MATVESLREHLVTELRDLLNAEQQLIKALPKMVSMASTRPLKTAFSMHLDQTRGHERRLVEALGMLGERASGTTCEAMKGLLSEGQELMQSGEQGTLLDAMMITAAQKVEHYEIASYGTVRTYAEVLGNRRLARLLQQTLAEEKAADKKLTGIAEGSINARAAKEFHQRMNATELLGKGAEWVGSAIGGAMNRVNRATPHGHAADRGTRRGSAARRTSGTSKSGKRQSKR